MLTDIGEAPFDASPVLYDSTLGLVAAVPGWLGSFGVGPAPHQEIERIDPRSGSFTHVASPIRGATANFEANVDYDGSLYVLAENAAGTNMVLYRVRLA